MSALDLYYSNVSDRPIGLAVRSAAAGWWRWSTSSWTSAYSPADHVLRCTPDPDPSPDVHSIQYATVPAAALVDDATVIDGIVTRLNATAVAGWTPWNTLMMPPGGYALAALPLSRGTLSARPAPIKVG